MSQAARSQTVKNFIFLTKLLSVRPQNHKAADSLRRFSLSDSNSFSLNDCLSHGLSLQQVMGSSCTPTCVPTCFVCGRKRFSHNGR